MLYRAPESFQRRVGLIHPDYFIIFNDRIFRWEIRKFLWRNNGNRDPRMWEINSERVRVITWDDESVDYGRYGKNIRPPSHRVIEDFKESLYWARNSKELLSDIDRSNARLAASMRDDEDYAHRTGARAIYKHYNEPTVFYGG